MGLGASTRPDTKALIRALAPLLPPTPFLPAAASPLWLCTPLAPILGLNNTLYPMVLTPALPVPPYPPKEAQSPLPGQGPMHTLSWGHLLAGFSARGSEGAQKGGKERATK